MIIIKSVLVDIMAEYHHQHARRRASKVSLFKSLRLRLLIVSAVVNTQQPKQQHDDHKVTFIYFTAVLKN